MSKLTERIQWLATAFAIAIGLGLGLAGAKTKVPAAKPDPICDYLGKGPTKETAGAISAGIQSCELCHIGTSQGRAVGYVEVWKSNEFVLLNESQIWLQSDIHSQ